MLAGELPPGVAGGQPTLMVMPAAGDQMAFVVRRLLAEGVEAGARHVVVFGRPVA
jgi:hypothetical protein